MTPQQWHQDYGYCPICDETGDNEICVCDPQSKHRTLQEQEDQERWDHYSNELSAATREWYDRANDNFNLYTMLRRRYERLDKVLSIVMRDSPMLKAIADAPSPWLEKSVRRTEPADLVGVGIDSAKIQHIIDRGREEMGCRFPEPRGPSFEHVVEFEEALKGEMMQLYATAAEPRVVDFGNGPVRQGVADDGRWNFVHSHQGNRHERRKAAAQQRKRQ